MLYLEDYLESKLLYLLQFDEIFFMNLLFSKKKPYFIYISVIEHLPSELRDRFFDMREMDLSVQSKCNTSMYT